MGTEDLEINGMLRDKNKKKWEKVGGAKVFVNF